MSTQGTVVKRHLTEHEQDAGLAPPVRPRVGSRLGPMPFDAGAGIRAALRHKFKLNGLHFTDEKLLMSDDEFAAALEATLGHAPKQVMSGPAKTPIPAVRDSAVGRK